MSEQSTTPRQNLSIILFDGECVLCNGFVAFLIERDRRKKFLFTSLQGKLAKEILPEKFRSMDSVVLFQNGQFSTESTAVIKILTQLGGFWSLFWCCQFLPSFLRNRGYQYIAKNRYRWFGKTSTCFIPAPEDRHRILD